MAWPPVDDESHSFFLKKFFVTVALTHRLIYFWYFWTIFPKREKNPKTLGFKASVNNKYLWKVPLHLCRQRCKLRYFNEQIKVLTVFATASDVATRDQPGAQGDIGIVRARFQQIIIDLYLLFLKTFFLLRGDCYVATSGLSDSVTTCKRAELLTSLE